MKGGFDDWKSIHVSKVSRLSNIFFFFFLMERRLQSFARSLKVTNWLAKVVINESMLASIFQRRNNEWPSASLHDVWTAAIQKVVFHEEIFNERLLGRVIRRMMDYRMGRKFSLAKNVFLWRMVMEHLNLNIFIYVTFWTLLIIRYWKCITLWNLVIVSNYYCSNTLL